MLLWSYQNPAQAVPLSTAAGDLGSDLAVPGICSGASARWCYKMLLMGDPMETKPELSVARQLQGEYQGAIKGKTAATLNIHPFFKAANLRAVEGATVGNLDQGDFSSTSLKARSNNGVYWYGPPGHAIAIARKSPELFYYFEPEQGLYSCKSPGELKTAIGMRYMDKLNLNTWWIVRVELA
jgi:hypothetical protein